MTALPVDHSRNEQEGPGVVDDPSPGELLRLLSRLSTEIAGLHQALDRLVRVDVYEAHRAAMTADVRRLERDIEDIQRGQVERDKESTKERAASKRIVWGAALGMVGTIIASVLVQVILR